MLYAMHVIVSIHIALSWHPDESRTQALKIHCSRFYAKEPALTEANAAC